MKPNINKQAASTLLAALIFNIIFGLMVLTSYILTISQAELSIMAKFSEQNFLNASSKLNHIEQKLGKEKIKVSDAAWKRKGYYYQFNKKLIHIVKFKWASSNTIQLDKNSLAIIEYFASKTYSIPSATSKIVKLKTHYFRITIRHTSKSNILTILQSIYIRLEKPQSNTKPVFQHNVTLGRVAWTRLE